MYSHLSCLVRLNRTQVYFPHLVRIFWAGVNTAIAIGCTPNNCTETQLKRWSLSASKQTLRRLNGWTNEWMTLSTRVVLFTVSGSLAKRAVWKRTAPNKKINIVFSPGQSKWTSRLSWCEYTLRDVFLSIKSAYLNDFWRTLKTRIIAIMGLMIIFHSITQFFTVFLIK